MYVNVYEKLLYQTNQLGDVIANFGLVVRIENSSYSTYYSYADGVFVSAGFQTNIVVDRSFKSILAEPYSNCEISTYSPQFIQGLDLYNLISESGYKYTQQLCFIQCYQKYIIKKYSCSYPAFLSIYNVSICPFNEVSNAESFDGTFINNNCISSCPLECDQTLYETSISSSLLNGYNYISTIKNNSNLALDFINRTLDATNAANSIVWMNIYYDSLTYTLSEESPQWNAVSLLGSIGGNLGLFLGVSFFSISEIIEVSLEILFSLRKKRNVGPALE